MPYAVWSPGRSAFRGLAWIVGGLAWSAAVGQRVDEHHDVALARVVHKIDRKSVV